MLWSFQPFKHKPHKMVKLTQTIRWQQPTIFLSVFDHFVRLALKVLRSSDLDKTIPFQQKLWLPNLDHRIIEKHKLSSN